MIYEKKTPQDYDLYQWAMDTAVIHGYVSAELLTKELNIEHSASEEIIEGFLIDKYIYDGESEGVYEVYEDKLLNETRDYAKTLEVISIFDIQRKHKIFWPKAKRLMYALEREGIVASGTLDEKRKVLGS